jgi:3,4-dihydroxy 2-butanone 4-phosphate synthase/GTP cyclohydrolase II
MTLPQALQRIADEGGILVLLGRHEDIAEQVKQFEMEDRGDKPQAADWKGSSRTVGVGSQILATLGVKQMRLLSKPVKYHALSGYGLEVVEYIHD